MPHELYSSLYDKNALPWPWDKEHKLASEFFFREPSISIQTRTEKMIRAYFASKYGLNKSDAEELEGGQSPYDLDKDNEHQTYSSHGKRSSRLPTPFAGYVHSWDQIFENNHYDAYDLKKVSRVSSKRYSNQGRKSLRTELNELNWSGAVGPGAPKWTERTFQSNWWLGSWATLNWCQTIFNFEGEDFVSSWTLPALIPIRMRLEARGRRIRQPPVVSGLWGSWSFSPSSSHWMACASSASSVKPPSIPNFAREQSHFILSAFSSRLWPWTLLPGGPSKIRSLSFASRPIDMVRPLWPENDKYRYETLPFFISRSIERGIMFLEDTGRRHQGRGEGMGDASPTLEIWGTSPVLFQGGKTTSSAKMIDSQSCHRSAPS